MAKGICLLPNSGHIFKCFCQIWDWTRNNTGLALYFFIKHTESSPPNHLSRTGIAVPAWHVLHPAVGGGHSQRHSQGNAMFVALSFMPVLESWLGLHPERLLETGD